MHEENVVTLSYYFLLANGTFSAGWPKDVVT
jgi:hypothetical protein